MSASKSGRPIVLLTIPQAAERLQCSVKMIYRLRKRGELDTVFVGGLRRIPESSVEDYKRRNFVTGGAA